MFSQLIDVSKWMAFLHTTRKQYYFYQIMLQKYNSVVHISYIHKMFSWCNHLNKKKLANNSLSIHLYKVVSQWVKLWDWVQGHFQSAFKPCYWRQRIQSSTLPGLEHQQGEHTLNTDYTPPHTVWLTIAPWVIAGWFLSGSSGICVPVIIAGGCIRACCNHRVIHAVSS